jgi:4a-hydroxytetrahydrobiopterin dehydratase
MKTLAKREMTICPEDAQPLWGNSLRSIYAELNPGWKLIDFHRIEKEVEVSSIMEGAALVTRIAEMAVAVGHDPNLLLSDGTLTISLYTHTIDGLHENDFILAAKIDDMLAGLSSGEK